MEQPSITIKEEDDEDVDDLVLLVNLKATKRSICKERKKYKKPKFGLEMLKEHIKSSVVKTPKTTTTQVVEEDKIEEIKEKEVMIEKEEEVKEYETIDQDIQEEEVLTYLICYNPFLSWDPAKFFYNCLDFYLKGLLEAFQTILPTIKIF